MIERELSGYLQVQLLVRPPKAIAVNFERLMR